MMKWMIVLVLSSWLSIGCRRPTETTLDRKESESIAEAGDRLSISSEDPNIRSILDQIVSIVLTSPDLKDSREFYGTTDDTRCALISNESYGIPWPEWYTPKLNGITFVRANEATDVEPVDRRLLGIRIDKLDLDDKTDENDFAIFGGPIQITLLNAGGDPDGVIVTGGASVYFRIEWEDRKPKLVYTGLLDA